MDEKEFLEKINSHTIAIYKNEINQVNEKSIIINWLLGLASIGLLFSFNRYQSIDLNNIWLITSQFIIFIFIIIVGFLYRLKVKSFKENTISIIRMFDFLKLEFQLVPDEIVNDLQDSKLEKIFNDYLNGEYFQEKDEEYFLGALRKQNRDNLILKLLSIISIFLMILQFGCFFLMILQKSF